MAVQKRRMLLVAIGDDNDFYLRIWFLAHPYVQMVISMIVIMVYE